MKTDIRIIISRHGEGLHNVAGKRISSIWKNELEKLRNHIFKNFENIPEINHIIDKHVKNYNTKRDEIAYNLLEKVDPTAYFDPNLTEKGKVQAKYSGKVLKTYLIHHQLGIAPYAFTSPFSRTINSLTEVLENFKDFPSEIFIIPELMEPSGRYVDRFSLNKVCGNHTILAGGIDVHKVICNTETDWQTAERAKKGLEKIYKHLIRNKIKGVPIIMIQGGIMEIFSSKFIHQEIQEIENSDLWDLNLSFDVNGNLISAELIEKIELNDAQKEEFENLLTTIQPSEDILKEQDFGLIEEALSILAKKAQREIVYLIINKLPTNHNSLKNCNYAKSDDASHLQTLAVNPTTIKNNNPKKNSSQNKRTTNHIKFEPTAILNLLNTITPLERIILTLYEKGMSISNIKDLLFEIYGYKLSKIEITIIINRLYDACSNGLSGL
ncbi:phosphoglycerate mutase family protein [Ascidiimonas sp. W6]|uniref:phosphoglycerate mutase family protein n=1 Tax=Ascidiimonas meishanensis TaxID=3128903 RepID=UPI0030EEAFCF